MVPMTQFPPDPTGGVSYSSKTSSSKTRSPIQTAVHTFACKAIASAKGFIGSCLENIARNRRVKEEKKQLLIRTLALVEHFIFLADLNSPTPPDPKGPHSRPFEIVLQEFIQYRANARQGLELRRTLEWDRFPLREMKRRLTTGSESSRLAAMQSVRKDLVTIRNSLEKNLKKIQQDLLIPTLLEKDKDFLTERKNAILRSLTQMKDMDIRLAELSEA